MWYSKENITDYSNEYVYNTYPNLVINYIID